MNRILSSAAAALVAGLAAAGCWWSCSCPSGCWMQGSTGIGFISFVLRWLHVLGGIVWVGMIWFVNFILFAALDEARRRRPEHSCTSWSCRASPRPSVTPRI